MASETSAKNGSPAVDWLEASFGRLATEDQPQAAGSALKALRERVETSWRLKAAPPKELKTLALELLTVAEGRGDEAPAAKAASKKATSKKAGGKKAGGKKKAASTADPLEPGDGRLEALTLRWFRGAGAEARLPLGGRSAAVYGPNGAGKSSFVDAVEHALGGGKIHHLAHEYSGTNQKLGILNTHRPEGEVAGYGLTFCDGASLDTSIAASGQYVPKGDAAARLAAWDYGRIVLRQDEVSRFIHETKGSKYSALLPLLGLGELEQAADNLRRLAKSIDKEGRLVVRAAQLGQREVERQDVFGGADNNKIRGMLAELFADYCGRTPKATVLAEVETLRGAMERRAAGQSEEQRLHGAFSALAAVDLLGALDELEAAAGRRAAAVEQLGGAVLEILARTAEVASGQEGDELPCPACGRSIATDALLGYVAAEQERLKEQAATQEAWQDALVRLSRAVAGLGGEVAAPARRWLAEEAGLGAAVTTLEGVEAEELRGGCDEAQREILSGILPLVEAAKERAQAAPPDVLALTNDRRLVDVGCSILEAEAEQRSLDGAVALRSLVDGLEAAIREEIRTSAAARVEAISADIRTMWSTLHPGEAIESIRLYLPDKSDKAIDIALQFFGVDQASPRLTLSEGHRNSLGLCIFLAMARYGDDTSGPLILDDVVVSLDAEHRGALLGLLRERFDARQVLLFTHDRSFFEQLRGALPEAAWSFGELAPFEGPEVGISWAEGGKPAGARAAGAGS